MKKAIILGLLAAFLAGHGARAIFGGSTCGDGTHSSSIGRRGACSHHGGVNRVGPTLSGLIALFAGGYVFLFVLNRDELRKKRKALLEEQDTD